MNLEKVTLKNTEKVGLVSNLSTMLSAGIPILDAVESILEDTKGAQKKILETLKEDLTQGRRINVSLAKFPRVFDKVTTSVIKASEEVGTLDVALKDLRENIRKETEFANKIRSALIYPAFLGVVFVGVMAIMLVFVVPKISDVFGRLRIELPLPTRILIAVSDLGVNNALSFFVITTAVIIGSVALFRARRKFFLNMFFSLPLVSSLVLQIDLTRFSRSMYLLLYSGMPLTGALELVRDIVSTREMNKVIENSRDFVLNGKTLAQGIKSSKSKTPGIMVKLVEAGEKTGTLDSSMLEISEYFDYQVSNTLKTMTALLEPIMLVVVAVIVGGMMMSIIAPIYGLIGQVGVK